MPDLASPDPSIRRAAERAAINMPVQGTAADIVKRAMIEAEEKCAELSLLLQIHDELLWEGTDATIQKKAPQVRTLLENVIRLTVPLRVELRTGPSWGSLKAIK